jgi:tRNA nucleotidyltransferase (CCA-adding enzyme)
MNDEKLLRERLRKIETLFAGAATAGEKAAAGAAAARIRERLASAARTEKPEETRFSVPDGWSRQLFTALCRRYGLEPYRYRRMHRQTLIVKAPRSFVNQVLWPEFQNLNEALVAYLAEMTERIIREEVYADVRDADEVQEPKAIG